MHVEAKADHLQSLARARPVNALSELIWNALDADADRVTVSVTDHEIGSPTEIRVTDNGSGIDPVLAERAFGNLGESWKKGRLPSVRQKRLHGRDGKGRFKAFSLGTFVSWETVYRDSTGDLHKYAINGSLKDICDFPIEAPVRLAKGNTGTTVVITGITDSLGLGLDGSALELLSEQFAIYLRTYPTVDVFFRGSRLDPKAVQSAARSMQLNPFHAADGTRIEGEVEVIEWSFSKKERKLWLCDGGGYPLHDVELGIRPGSEFNFTAYLKSDFIAKLHERNMIGVAEMSPDLMKLVEEARVQLRAYFRQRKAATASALVDDWKKEGIYPFHGDAVDLVERARREVFDICAVNVNEYLETFKTAAFKDRKLILKLIATAVDENPESLKKILSDILELPKDKLNDFADLLDHTTLPAMIEASKTVADRLKFLAGLQEILFDPTWMKSLKERKHLQKILERETWIFGEEYLLTNSDENLNTVLKQHLGELRPELKKRKNRRQLHDANAAVLRDDGKEGVIDLLLARELPQYGRTRREFLVVEIKRPSQVIDLKVKGQIESYALAVLRDPRFDVLNTHWTFVAISTEMTTDAALTVTQQDKPLGFFHVRDNLKIGLARWSEVIQGSRTRLDLFRDKLNYTATKDDGLKLLHDKYNKFLPQSIDDLDISE